MITNDLTQGGERPLREQSMSREMPAGMQMQMQQNTMQGVACPKCGTINEPDAMYCASCGALMRMDICPNCGAEIDPEADYCEACHHYIRTDICAFCGAHLAEDEGYCPECGAPRGGMVCPTCHTMNDFAFCKQCGMPLTEEARQLVAQLKEIPEYKELMSLAHEYSELDMQLPYNTERDATRDKECLELRDRILRLLAQDDGIQNPVIPEPKNQRMSKEELNAQKRRKLEQIAEMLDQLAIPPQPSPAKVRNFAMAQKPTGVRLAWRCNYKNAMHSSPCGCAKPQMGGKWIVLGHNSKQEIKDDK